MSSLPKKISPRKKIQKKALRTREPREPQQTWFMDPLRLRSSDIEELLDKPVTQGQRPPRGTPNIKRLREVSRFYELWTDNNLTREGLLNALLVFLRNEWANSHGQMFSDFLAEKLRRK